MTTGHGMGVTGILEVLVVVCAMAMTASVCPVYPWYGQPLARRRVGFTFVELLVVLIAVAVIASLVYPVFWHPHGGNARRATCTSQVRQIATAVQMYAQDNKGVYPGIDGGSSWVSKLATYLGGSAQIFMCPEDTSGNSGKVSYAFSGLLIRTDGKGMKEANVLSPSEVGCLCDASPSENYPSGRLIGGGAQMEDMVIAATPAARHSKGIITGYCDGHAKYTPGAFIDNDMANEIARAFYQVSPLGLVDNPAACVPPFTVAGPRKQYLVVGGEYALYPIIMGSAELWSDRTKAVIFTRGCNGQFYTEGREANYAWGVGDNKQPPAPSVAVARDAVVVIVSKTSKIPGLGTYTNDSYEVDYPTIRRLFGKGYEAGTVQVYQMPRTGTHRFLVEKLGDNGKLAIGPNTVTVANDLEMVDKVANDAYGIGYCSSVFADPNRVTSLALCTPSGHVFYYPRQGPKFRWIMPEKLDWPLSRTLYVQFGGKAWIDGKPSFGTQMLAPGSPGMTALQAGPLFKAGYYLP